VAAFFKNLSKTPGVTVTPDLLAGVLDNPSLMQADGLHPNAKGARVIAEKVAPIVATSLRGAPRLRP
jgi:acyl-CoA thioesterase-1